jgi:hypothetical protein
VEQAVGATVTHDARWSGDGRSREGATVWTGVVSGGRAGAGGRLEPERGVPACGTGARKECLAATFGASGCYPGGGRRRRRL